MDTPIDLRRRIAIQVRGGEASRVQDTVCTERVFRLYLNDQFLTELVASPEHPKELGAGFVICEGLARQIDAVNAYDNQIHVAAHWHREINWELRSCAGPGLKGKPRRVESATTIAPSDVFRIRAAIETEAWRKTGGLHCSVLFRGDELLARSNDVGRHNTVDKVTGFAVLNGIDLSACVIGCSGRQPAGMVSKVANAGIPIIVSKAAATDRGITTADEAGVTLICFARDDRFTIYTHPHRVLGIAATLLEGGHGLTGWIGLPEEA